MKLKIRKKIWICKDLTVEQAGSLKAGGKSVYLNCQEEKMAPKDQFILILNRSLRN